MPEGDTVYRTARFLDRELGGRVLAGSDFRVPHVAVADLSGQTVTGTVTYGKHLFSRTDAGLTLHTHLGMDGSWSALGVGKRLPKVLLPGVRVLLRRDDGRQAVGRLLAVVQLFDTSREGTVTERLGPDPLRDDWDAAEAVRRLTIAPERPVVAALLDQHNLAGLGNLWVNEVCFLRGHHPQTPVAHTDAEALVDLAARLLHHAAFSGRPPQRWVYGRGRDTCRRCGTPIRHRSAVPGDPERRDTWWCPHCQR